MTFAEPVNMTNLVDVFTYANTVSGNYFGMGILVALYVIVFINLNLKGEEPQNALTVAGWITSLAGVFLFLMNLIDSLQFFITLCGLIIPMIWSYFDKD